MSKRAMVVGGSNGIGLAFVSQLLQNGCQKVYIVDKVSPELTNEKIEYIPMNLTDCDYRLFQQYLDVDTLIITAGFGRLAHFESFSVKEIENVFQVNSVSVINIIKQYYEKLLSDDNFNCVVMGSIAGLISSPLFSVYSATKAALCRFIESLNVELTQRGTKNRILNVSPGSLKGTKFSGGVNQIEVLDEQVKTILYKMKQKEELYIPDYDTVYKDVIKRYQDNPQKFGNESYTYKLNSGRIQENSRIKIGYLSGTFDLFHIGHLNLLKRAKQHCDYLIVGVHKDASHKGKTTFIPFEERTEILKSIRYVDEVITAKAEDMDVYQDVKYHYLFVGSDYKGTERFQRYEEYFKDKGVEIVYFPYTEGTSSTQIRGTIDQFLAIK